MRVLTKSLWSRILLVACLVPFLTACNETRRIVWSADGTRALVLAGDGLRLCRPDGTISDVLLNRLTQAEWIPGGNRIAVVRQKSVDSWSKLIAIESKESVARAIGTARAVMVKARQNKGSWKQFTKSVDGLPALPAAAIYLKENNHQELQSLFGQDWTKTQRQIKIVENILCTFRLEDSKLVDERVLLETFRDLMEMRVSPGGKALLCVTRPDGAGKRSPYDLLAVSTGSGDVKKVSGRSSRYPDWLNDKTMLYIESDGASGKRVDQSDGKKHYQSASLISREVLDDEGKILKFLKPARNLSKLIFDNRSRVRSVGHGGIVFSAVAARLPCTEAQIPSRQSIFVVYPNYSAVVSRLVPHAVEHKLGDMAHTFEVNRERSAICISNRDGRVTIYKVATGKVSHLTGRGFGSSRKINFLPQWRNDDEITVSLVPSLKGKMPAGRNRGAEVVLWSIDEPEARAISIDWPEPARKGWLD